MQKELLNENINIFGLIEIELGDRHKQKKREEITTLVSEYEEREKFLKEFTKEFVGVLPAFVPEKKLKDIQLAMFFFDLAKDSYKKKFKIKD